MKGEVFMAFTNSPLVSMISISPNRNIGRYNIVNGVKVAPITKITKITIHHWAGVGTLETFKNIVMNPKREMSANYAIDVNGKIGLFCPEADRSWCSSSQYNDNRAITIEVSNSAYGDATGWPISDASYKALIRLCVDICKRNGIPKLYYDGTNGTLTRHCDLAATGCPGPYIKSKTQQICNDVNAQLQTASTPDVSGYLVSLEANAPIYDTAGGKEVSKITKSTKYTIIKDKKIGYITYGQLKSGAGWVVIKNETPAVHTPVQPVQKDLYTKSFKANEPVYKDAGGQMVGSVGANGVFTIVEEKTVGNIVYGKLKSGKGWVVVKKNEPPKPTPAPVQTSWWSGKYDAQIKELQQILNVGGAGLVCDGIAGDKTFQACKKYTVKKGDTGNLIKWVQKRLGISADGIAGNQTMNAIYAFQRKYGLGVGYLGGNDWKYLIR
jgi:N-acetyl-anhydromuramyl-L-alanine amidase AmpD